MTKPLRIVGMAGSLRADSYCKIVLNSLADMLPAGSEFVSLDIGELPHYNQDLDSPVGPAQVHQARDLIASADAVLMVVPEFNHGIPGVLKNALDWLSRPAFTSCMVGKPVMFATLSPARWAGSERSISCAKRWQRCSANWIPCLKWPSPLSDRRSATASSLMR